MHRRFTETDENWVSINNAIIYNLADSLNFNFIAIHSIKLCIWVNIEEFT